MICLLVLLALFGHAPSLTSPLRLVEVEALPSQRVLLSRWSSVVWPPPTSHPASRWISLLQLIPAVTASVEHRPNEISPVPSPTFTTSRSPYAGGFFTVASSGSSPLPWPSPADQRLGFLLVPFGLTCRRCKIHFMLRAAVLLPFLRGVHRISTAAHAAALDACYMAS